MKKRRLLPFGFLPGHWGLSGETREIAKIEYEYEDCYIRDEMISKIKYTGVDLENKLNGYQLAHGLIDDYQFEINRIKINFSGVDREKLLLKHDLDSGVIDQEKYQYACAELIEDVKERQLELAQLDYKFNKVNHNEYKKLVADINNESWVAILNIDSGDEDNPESLPSIELDWNDKFIEELRSAGYKGNTDEDVANDWLVFLCRNIALQDLAGVGDFEESLEYRDMESWEKTRQEMGIETVKTKGNK